jgi:hypothetical protein
LVNHKGLPASSPCSAKKTAANSHNLLASTGSDEPVAGLDPVVMQELYQLIEQINMNLYEQLALTGFARRFFAEQGGGRMLILCVLTRITSLHRQRSYVKNQPQRRMKKPFVHVKTLHCFAVKDVILSTIATGERQFKKK